MTDSVNIDLTPQARKIIDRLFATGLYGPHESDVAERLFYEKLREMDRLDEPPEPAFKPQPR